MIVTRSRRKSECATSCATAAASERASVLMQNWIVYSSLSTNYYKPAHTDWANANGGDGHLIYSNDILCYTLYVRQNNLSARVRSHPDRHTAAIRPDPTMTPTTIIIMRNEREVTREHTSKLTAPLELLHERIRASEHKRWKFNLATKTQMRVSGQRAVPICASE